MLFAFLVLGVFAGSSVLAAKRRSHSTRRTHARPARPRVSELNEPDAGVVPPEKRPPRRIPRLVFVSRRPLAGAPGAVPGVGPHDHTAAPGGRLLVRDTTGAVHELLSPGTLFDVSDPSVSFDGTRIAFAGTMHPDSAWRIYVVHADGTQLTAITRGDRAPGVPASGPDSAFLVRYDDFDPCWITNHRLVIASTRYPLVAQYGHVAASNLYLLRDDGTSPMRLTTERNGAEEPALDSVTGRLVFTRWWYNRHRPTNRDASGLTTVASMALGDSINLWQAVSVTPDSSDLRLAAGDPLSRRGETIYQPAPLDDGCLVGVTPTHLAFSPTAGGLALEIFGLDESAGRGGLPRAVGPARRLAGPAVSDAPTDAYHDARGLAAPAACSPVGIGAGTILFSYDPGGRGDFGLYAMDEDGERLERVFDLAGTLELDATTLAPRTPHLLVTDANLDARPAAPAAAALPLDARAVMTPPAPGSGFTFHCLNLFANAPLDSRLPDAPAPVVGLRVRFFANLPGVRDSAVLVREAPVSPRGEILVSGLTPGVPMFEQVVGADGLVLMSAHGPAHVAGLNASSPDERRCVGCHTGHSAMFVPPDVDEAQWFNVSPAAEVTASSAAAGSGGARAAVDRSTRGPVERVAWIAERSDGQWLRLAWKTPIVFRKVGLYAVRPGTGGTGLIVRRCEIVLFRSGVEVRRLLVDEPLSATGTFAGTDPLEVDVLEVHVLTTLGHAPAGRAPLLAEVETIARLP
jgi:hypothetical protein